MQFNFYLTIILQNMRLNSYLAQLFYTNVGALKRLDNILAQMLQQC